MTHCQRVLALLSDGKPHSHRELYGLYVIAHSRISDLRKRGHTIEMWREGDDYFYRLTDSATEPSDTSPLTYTVGSDTEPESRPETASVAEQLSLVAA